MAVSNLERVTRGMDALKRGLAPYIMRHLMAHHKDRWCSAGVSTPLKVTVDPTTWTLTFSASPASCSRRLINASSCTSRFGAIAAVPIAVCWAETVSFLFAVFRRGSFATGSSTSPCFGKVAARGGTDLSSFVGGTPGSTRGVSRGAGVLSLVPRTWVTAEMVPRPRFQMSCR